jgi:hypothetical protein
VTVPFSTLARRAARLAKYPFWAAQLFTGAKSFIDNPIIGNERLNAFGLHVLRRAAAQRAATRRRNVLERLVRPEHRASFARDGFVLVENFLPRIEFDRLSAEVNGYRGRARQMLQGDTITRRIALEPNALKQMPSVAKLLSNAEWYGLQRFAASHNRTPVYYLQAIWAGIVPGPPDPQTVLHTDTFHATAKAWLTLTDVAAQGTPFIYVPGSHRMTPARRQWEQESSMRAANAARLTARGSFRITENELAALGYPSPKSFPIPKNSLLVADTSGFHARGVSVAPSLRVEVWGYLRASPFLTLPFDLWGNPILGQRRASAFWSYADALERFRNKPNPWRRCENCTIFDPPIERSD